MKYIPIMLVLALTATNVRAEDHTSPAPAEVPELAFDLPLNQEQAKQFLESLFSLAAANVREYVELESSRRSVDPTIPPQREFRLRLYPKGKSRSQDHYTAEGSFSLEPKHPRSEFRFRFDPAPSSDPTGPHLDGDPV
jgi:hypothetical protein